MLKKIKIFFVFLIFLLFILFLLSLSHVYKKSELEYGVTFSKKQAVDLGLDWKQAYSDMLSDLKVKKLRLPAYWNEIEPTQGSYNYEDLDWQVNTASAGGAEIILAIGGRLPRWPECHWPGWAGRLSEEKRENEILAYLEKTITRYKNVENITAWQIENEPFLAHFGDCPNLNKNFLDKEIALARSLDSRPLVITDSGELSFWIPAAKRADIFGTTMYRDTYSQYLKNYVHYPITPAFFKIKRRFAQFFAHPREWIVIELAAEPWCPISFQKASQAERDRTMNLEKFKSILEFARLTGFKKFYLWGVEWWYWEKTVNNNPALWEEAKGLFN